MKPVVEKIIGSIQDAALEKQLDTAWHAARRSTLEKLNFKEGDATGVNMGRLLSGLRENPEQLKLASLAVVAMVRPDPDSLPPNVVETLGCSAELLQPFVTFCHELRSQLSGLEEYKEAFKAAASQTCFNECSVSE